MDQPTLTTHEDNAALWDWDLVTNRIHFSPRWLSWVGCEHHEIGSVPDVWFDRIHPDDRAQVLRSLEAARATGSSGFSFDHRLGQKGGAFRWVTCRGVVIRTDAGQAIRILGSHTDITADMLADPLTDLPNRQLFVDRLTQSIARGQRNQAFHFAVLLIDLGPVASITPSDAASAPAVLTAVARRLETCLRVSSSTASWRDDDLLARLAPHQFGVLLDGLTDIAQIQVIGDRLLREVLAPFDVDEQSVFLTASIGVAVSATGYTQAGEALRDAETALHRARGLGGSRCAIFDTAIVRSEQAELELQNDFDGALERAEFHVVYQPVVAVDSAQIVGFEALVRWQHPRLGALSPVHFISIAERTGFMVPLGAWVLRAACQQLRAWQTAIPGAANLWMSVNVSSVQMRHVRLISEVSAALHDVGVDARFLALELTERVAVENPAAVRTVLMQLRNLGVRISIDDFGTGYSSLAYLSQLPVDALKIDRSFIRGIDTQHDKVAILKTLTAMGRQLKLHVVAEGIEDEENLAYLRAVDCDSAQGFLFAKPLDVVAATELLRTGLPPRPERNGLLLPGVTLSHDHSSRWSPSWRVLTAGAALVMVCAGLAWVAYRREAPAVSVSLPPVEPQVTPIGPLEPNAAPAQPALEEPVALRTVHLHRFGTCEGGLVVSRSGIVFTPNATGGHESLRFKFNEFLYAVSNDTLTIRSQSGNYRFRASQPAKGGLKRVALADFVTAIVRFGTR